MRENTKKFVEAGFKMLEGCYCGTDSNVKRKRVPKCKCLVAERLVQNFAACVNFMIKQEDLKNL